MFLKFLTSHSLNHEFVHWLVNYDVWYLTRMPLDTSGNRPWFGHDRWFGHHGCAVQENEQCKQQVSKVMMLQSRILGQIYWYENSTQTLLQRLLVWIVTRGLLVTINQISFLVAYVTQVATMKWCALSCLMFLRFPTYFHQAAILIVLPETAYYYDACVVFDRVRNATDACVVVSM
jgi:hypothetical protein